MNIAITPNPPYYAVIFTSVRSKGDNDYSNNADWILQIAEQQPGFLGFESARNEIGISVSYWDSLEAIREWKHHVDHISVQRKAKDWYTKYKVRISLVERDYGFNS